MEVRRKPVRGGALTPEDLRPPVADDDRRREPRIPCEREIAILPYQASGNWEFKSVGLFDCSSHGLGIISDEPMAIGEQFLAKLKLGSSRALVIYTVRHCLCVEGRYFKIGAEFSGLKNARDDYDTSELLQSVLSSPAPAEADSNPS